MKSAFTSSEKRAIAGLATIMAARMLGFFIVLPVFSPYAIHTLGATKWEAGLAFGAYGLSQALLQIPFGHLSDRYGRRVVVGGGLVLFIAGSLMCALSADIRLLTLGMFLQGCGAVASALFAWVADSTAPERRHFSMALLGIAIGAALVLGLSIANPLAATIGVRGIFAGCAALSGLALVVVCLMVEPRSEAEGSVGAPVLNQDLASLNLAGFIVFFSMRAVFFTVPLALEAQWPKPEQWKIYLPISLLGGIAMMTGSRLSDKGRARVMILTALGLTMAAYSMIGFIPAMGAVLVGYAAYFAGFSMLEALLPAAVSKIAPSNARGSTIGVYNTCQYLGAFFGSGLAGGLVDRPHALYASLLVMSLGALVGCACLHRLDERPVDKRDARKHDHPSVTSLEAKANS
ncbi:MAG: MFS transporter [Armatimonadetes bacterium]|nr:MFS transporter [Armatimonadota bacterium]